jgi:hypothetical protein
MAQPTIKLSADWSLVTSATTFTAQNIATAPVELRFSGSTPAASDQGFVVGFLMGLTDAAGTGNLYGRGTGGVLTVSEQ